MERVRPKADPALGWAFRPDAKTLYALAQGRDKLKKHPELGSDRPHRGGNLAEALAKERDERQVRQTKRRKKVAKKVTTLKEMAKRSKSKADFGDEVKPKKKLAELAPVSKAIKKLAKEKESGNGKMIPLKRICDELDLDPKATRVKLRRLIEKGEIDFHDHSQRWEFTPSQAKEIRSHLE